MYCVIIIYFFFQAEDGIRDIGVTGVQTCALPILLEFVINNKHYAINVIKVKEVVEVDNLTELPDSHPAIAGLILCRDEIITLIDLRYILNGQKSEKTKSKVIICEFNQIKVAFNIDDIVAVHRIKWDTIVKPDDLSANSLVTGNILL